MSNRAWGKILGGAVLLGLALITSTEAVAQKTVSIRYKPTAVVSPPLTLHLVTESSGQIRGVVGAVGQFTLNRSLVEVQPDGGTVATFEALVSRETAAGDARSAELTLRFQGSAGNGYDLLDPFLADLELDTSDSTGSGEGGGEVNAIAWNIRGGAGSSGEALELRFAARTQTEVLRGEPSHLFNNPLPGEDLVFTLPTLLPAETFSVRLTVESSEGSYAGIPTNVLWEICNEPSRSC